MHIDKRTNTDTFNGVLIVKFASRPLRDQAVSLLHRSRLDGKDIWAKEDLPLDIQVRKSFLNSLKYQLGKWSFVYKEFGINEECTEMEAGGSQVLSIEIRNGLLKCTWNDAWAQWAELQDSPELKALLDKASKDLAGNGKGRGKSKYPAAVQ